jgi:hypothetical protein
MIVATTSSTTTELTMRKPMTRSTELIRVPPYP